MRIIHLSDTHLGFSAYRKISAAGYNIREEDICSAFAQSIDRILELKPDLVLHAGDLFDSVRPTNRILTYALEQILRLIKARIPLILISGNHETPKQRYIGSALAIFEKILAAHKLLYVIYKNEYTPITFEKVTIHAVPQCTNDEIFQNELKKIKGNPQTKNILMLHAGISGMEEFSHGDFNELLADKEFLEKLGFDYVALGHYHNYLKIGANIYFSGSTERLSFNEAGLPKGFIEIDLENSTYKFHELKIRPMVNLTAVDCANKDSAQITAEIENRLKNTEIEDKILRLKISNIPAHIFNTLDVKKIRELTEAALHFEPVFEKLDEGGKPVKIKTSFSSLKEEFISFINQYPNLSEKEKEIFKTLGIQAIEEAAQP